MRKISYDDYLRLLGLLKLAEDTNRRQRELEHSVARLLGVPNQYEDIDNPYYGHASDAVYGNRDVGSLLEVLGIEVEPAVATEPKP